jgi:two-component system response regulator HydG
MVVADVRMPGMSGIEVVKEASRIAPALPIILITGHSDVRAAVQAMQLGAFDYVIKPPDQEEFKLIISRALEHSRLQRENQVLLAELTDSGLHGNRLQGSSEAMQGVLSMIKRVAHTNSTVLITGETGTGKELVARTIHYNSKRANHPLVAVNCAALNDNLIESEFFGHEKGAFTGAITARRGRFEEATGGTLMLDEISETSVEFQAKLLRAIQEREIRRVGGDKTITVDARIIAVSNRDLRKEVSEGRFREDLFYRLSVISLNVPPLRERAEDISLLAHHFMLECARRYQCPARSFSTEAIKYLEHRQWEGNVRELEHTIERAVVLSDNDILETVDLHPIDDAGSTDAGDPTLRQYLDNQSRQYVQNILEKTGWHKQRAAEILGVDRATLYRILKKTKLAPASGSGG